MMNTKSAPMVSVFCLAYNHMNFIERAIEGMLMQKTNFDIEIVIGEDHSTDGTRKIVMDYAKNYPEIITAISSDQNVGMKANATRTRNACRGKYIAFCEGDDYWTHPLKLQKQVDFLEANPDFSICFHNAIILWDDKSRSPDYFCPKDQKEITTTEDVIRGYYISTASMLLRGEYFSDFPEWFKGVYNGDWGIQLLYSTRGKIKYIDELMSVYRKNFLGLSGSAGEKRDYIAGKKIELLRNFNEETNHKFDQTIQDNIRIIENDLREFNNKKKNKFLYWLFHPQKATNKILKSRKPE